MECEKDSDDYFEEIKHLAMEDLSFYDLSHKIIRHMMKYIKQ